ncbi:RHS repeat domain-containing protein [Streptomyces sp. NPDC058145]|uniref:RHS repeat domain-containing protein n=1 Tax=Streptomyces sp. NPDC058145 TaxID=3346356 RepID=UPI0036E0B1EE
MEDRVGGEEAAYGRVVVARAAASATTSYTYNPAGQVESIKDNASNTWSYTYNLLGQKLTQTDPNTGTTSFDKYDMAGNLLQTTDPRGQALSFTLLRRAGFAAAGQTSAPATGNVTYTSTTHYTPNVGLLSTTHYQADGNPGSRSRCPAATARWNRWRRQRPRWSRCGLGRWNRWSLSGRWSIAGPRPCCR